MGRLLVRALDHIEPERRRLWAAWTVIATLVGWLASAILLRALGQGSFFNELLNAISWLAITLTGVDVLSTTDVRANETPT